jgi:cytochrome c oxidase assembly protein subunit 15
MPYRTGPSACSTLKCPIWSNLLISTAPSAASASALPPPALRRFAWAVLAYFIAVILWGTLVRATGAGCGNRWPLCIGTVLQQSAQIETLIGPAHRIASALSLVFAVGLLAWTLRSTVRGHLARITAAAAVLFTPLESILGSVLVKLGYSARQDADRPIFLALHLANMLLLLAALTLTAHLLGRTTGFRRGHIRFAAPLGAICSVVAFMAAGITGALASDIAADSNWLIYWRWTHPTVAFLSSMFLIWILFRAAGISAHWDNRDLSAVILLLLAVQYLLGFFDVLLLVPTWLQIVHLLGAAILWIALVVLTARITLQPANSE